MVQGGILRAFLACSRTLRRRSLAPALHDRARHRGVLRNMVSALVMFEVSREGNAIAVTATELTTSGRSFSNP